MKKSFVVEGQIRSKGGVEEMTAEFIGRKRLIGRTRNFRLDCAADFPKKNCSLHQSEFEFDLRYFDPIPLQITHRGTRSRSL
jgi:hypothetical protein